MLAKYRYKEKKESLSLYMKERDLICTPNIKTAI